MADAVKIKAETRDPAKNKGTGTTVSRKLRSQGRVPAIVYGHKQAPQPISLTREAVAEMLKKATHLAELDYGTSTEMVLVRDVQWDYLGKDIIHLDFARVDASEAIETEVRLEIRGTATGVAEGGVLEIAVHSLTVTCRADAIPESIRVDVTDLHLGKSIHVKDLVLPAGVKLDADPELLLVHVVEPVVEPEPEAADVTQPVVIKAERKEKDD
jgi:large subunit ribosomal protein L25